MLFRQAGIHHTDYASDRALFPVPADRIMIIGLLLLAVSGAVTASTSSPMIMKRSAGTGNSARSLA